MDDPTVWLCLGIIGLAFAALLLTRWPPDAILLGALCLLVACEIIDLETAISGFANQAVLTVAALYVLAEGVRRSGALQLLTRALLLGPGHGLRLAMTVLLFPVAFFSAFINNTPVVAMLLPSVRKWARQRQFSPRSLLIPLSYAAILGGTCTIIGTSTNLLVVGMVQQQTGYEMDFFAITPIGMCVSIIGLLYIIIAAPMLLRSRHQDEDVFEHPEEFTLEFIVPPDSPLIHTSLGEIQAGNKHGLTPAEIVRGETLIPAPQAGELLQANDRLVFAGPAVELLAVHQIDGLDPAEDRLFGNEPGKARRVLVSAVLAARSPLIGTRIGEGRFRRLYGGAVMAVARSGHRISAADQEAWTFRAGDTLLIEARHDFIRQHGNNRDFYLVSDYDEPVPDQQWLPWLVLGITVLLMCAVAFHFISMLLGAVIAGLIFYGLRVFDSRQARTSIDLQVVCVMAAAIGIGAALKECGILGHLAEALHSMGSATMALILLFIMTAVLTEVISNAAAAAVMTPMALALSVELGGDPLPWALCVMMAASASFITPLGYQTNLMVYGPGNYRFKDFLIFGLPLSIIVGTCTVLIAPHLGTLSS